MDCPVQSVGSRCWKRDGVNIHPCDLSLKRKDVDARCMVETVDVKVRTLLTIECYAWPLENF